jgi:integrase
MRMNPLDDVRRPAASPSRKRRASAEEIDWDTITLGYDGGAPEIVSQRVALCFLSALETAMRSGEIVGMTWADVSPKSVHLPKTKNGDEREVPLSRRARELLSLQPRDSERVFGLNDAIRDALFRKGRDSAKVVNLTLPRPSCRGHLAAVEEAGCHGAAAHDRSSRPALTAYLLADSRRRVR